MKSHRGLWHLVMASFLLLFIPSPTIAQSNMETGFLNRTVEVSGTVYPYQVYIPSSYTPATRWPVILFLHGAGERGSDGLAQTQVGIGTVLRFHPERYPAIVVFPQVPSDSLWAGVPGQMAMDALDKTMKEFAVDQDRVYLTGISMGGNGTWYLAYRYPTRFAAVVPICGWVTAFNAWAGKGETVVPAKDGTPFEALAKRIGKVPVWIFHGEEDNTVPAGQSRQAADALKEAGANVQYTEIPGIGHNSWDPAYGSTKFAAWLLKQKR
jgi:predicted peptidase